LKVKTSIETVEKLIALLKGYDAFTEQFLNDLPTPEKYTILSMALIVQGHYEDFEVAYEESMHKVSAQDLTKYLRDYPWLWCHLQDALMLKWSHFEVLWTDDDEEDDDTT
jgi:hypothetical protein